MDDVNEQIEREVARKLAEHYARQEAREHVTELRNRRWQAELARRDDAKAERQVQREHRCGAKTTGRNRYRDSPLRGVPC